MTSAGDRAFDRHSRGRHCNRPYVALLYGRPLLCRHSSVDRAFSRGFEIRVAGLWVGFEVINLAGLCGSLAVVALVVSRS